MKIVFCACEKSSIKTFFIDLFFLFKLKKNNNEYYFLDFQPFLI